MSVQDRPRLSLLASTDGERHAEFKRRRDEFDYMKVPTGGEVPYLTDGWQISKKLKRQLRLAKRKSIDRHFEDRVWRLLYRMGYVDLNKGHDFLIRFKAADGSYREKQVDLFAKDAETVVVGECKCCEDYRARSLSKDLAEFIGLRKQLSDAIRSHYGHEGTSNNCRFCRVMGHNVGCCFQFDRRFHGSVSPAASVKTAEGLHLHAAASRSSVTRRRML